MKRILITRPSAQAGEFGRAIWEAGLEPVCFPVIEIGPPDDVQPLDEALRHLGRYDWLVLTSVNGVAAVWERLEALEIARLPESLKVAAIGPKTAAALQARGVEPDFVPGEYVAEAILPGLGEVAGQRVLLARADLARPALREAITAAGGLADEVVAYRTLPAQPDAGALAALRAGVDVVTFTSSSTVRNFVALARGAGLDPANLPGRPRVACIGPVTAATAREAGLQVDVVAVEYTTDGLLEILLKEWLHESEP